MSDVHRIEMRPAWVGGKHGYKYDLAYEGVVVVERSSQPLCDAARFLIGRGKDGKVELARPGGLPCLSGEISRYAVRKLVEPDRGQLHYQKWSPFDAATRAEVFADE